MDPFSAEGELVNIHTAFHQGQYQSVLDFDISSLSPSNSLPAKILRYRAQIALGQADAVLSELRKDDGSADMAAVKVLAQFTKNPEAAQAKAKAIELSQSQAENLTVQLLCGTVLANVGMKEEAVALLTRHQGSLDAVALLVQIHLSQYRLDLAKKEVQRARSWAQDNLLVNLAESWVGLREGGEKYQSAFYVYEELATAPGSTSPHNVLGQAIAELHLGRLPEAEAALDQALSNSPEDADILANVLVMNTILGRDAEANDAKAKLESLQTEHVLVKDLKAKRELFEAARAKYTPKFEIQGQA